MEGGGREWGGGGGFKLDEAKTRAKETNAPIYKMGWVVPLQYLYFGGSFLGHRFLPIGLTSGFDKWVGPLAFIEGGYVKHTGNPVGD